MIEWTDSHGVEGHVGIGRLAWMLDHGDAAAGFDGTDAGCAVVQDSGENYTNDPLSIGPRYATEENID